MDGFFTIADEIEELIDEVVKICLDKSVCYVCCAGKLCSVTEDIFDEEIVERAIRSEAQTGEEFDYEFCIDLTTKGVKGHLTDLVSKIKNKWLPSDEDFEDPVYDHLKE